MKKLHGILFCILATCLALPALAQGGTDCIAVIGTGSVGGALGPRFAGLGKRIVYGSRTPNEARVKSLVLRTGTNANAVEPARAAAACGTIVLAVPGEVVGTVVKSLGKLDGKLVIDVTNPLGAKDGVEFAIEVPAPSGGELVQSLARNAAVVKAFNTLSFHVMTDPAMAGGPVTVPLAGDDEAAKAQVAKLVAGIGLEPLDVGPLRTARYTEAMALLYVSRLVSGKRPFEFYLRPWPEK
jgi:predicted dinucleotide-binding enzyme